MQTDRLSVLGSVQGMGMAEEKNILIVDDDVELGSLLAKAVSDMSDAYAVKVARDVDEAMVQVRKSQTDQNTFDLVITDIKMSGLSGLELLEALNTIAPGTKAIAMTAYNSSDIADRARELNVEAYLTKPFIISEFRQIVRETLDAPSTLDSPVPAQSKEHSLPEDQKTPITRALASLRTMTGAVAAVLMHSGKALAADVQDTEMDIDALCATLEMAQNAMTEQMTQALSEDCLIRQSYFGSAAFSICAFRLSDTYTAAVVFGPPVKEGQVWYYLRDASSTLLEVLTGGQIQRTGSGALGDVQEMLNEYLPERPRRSRPRPDETQPEPDKTAPRPDGTTEPSPSSASEPVPPVAPTIDLSGLDEVDFGASPEMDWNEVVQSTDQGFSGLSFEEAQKEGLVSEAISPSETEAQADEAPEAVDRPPVDTINWDVGTDMDWDRVVADTDQGLDGLSLDEARKKGLVGDIGDE